MSLCSRLVIAFERNQRLAPHYQLLPLLSLWLRLNSGRRWTVSVSHSTMMALCKRPLIHGTFLQISQRRTCMSQITYTSTSNAVLTTIQRCLGCEVGTSQGKSSLARLQTFCETAPCTLSITVADMNYRCCNAPLQTTAEIDHNLRPSWNQSSSTSPPFPS
jgi:hypothetical protein